MQLPAIREKLTGLPRSLKILLPILSISILVIIIEGTYYFWTTRKKSEESKYINTEVACQEGVYLYDKATNEPIAIRGWVTNVDGWILTLENGDEQMTVEINKDFGYIEINENPRELPPSSLAQNVYVEDQAAESSGEVVEKNLVDRGFLKEAQFLRINDLSELLNIGSFIISDFEISATGKIKGNNLSVLEYLNK